MKHILIQFTRREATPAIQFLKYGMAGGVATGVFWVCFNLLALTIFPAMKEGELILKLFNVDAVALDEAERLRNYRICTVWAFLVANTVAYILNVLWVFEPGRHRRHVEVSLFFGVSAFAALIGMELGATMIRIWGTTTTISVLANITTAVMINFVCRKFIVFKG